MSLNITLEDFVEPIILGVVHRMLAQYDTEIQWTIEMMKCSVALCLVIEVEKRLQTDVEDLHRDERTIDL